MLTKNKIRFIIEIIAKKLVLLIIIVSTTTCVVNGTTGLIVITNLSDRKIENIKIGDTVLTYSLDRGAKYDYWYGGSLIGKIKADGVDVIRASYGYVDIENNNFISFYKDNAECHFITNYQYNLDIQKINDKYTFTANAGYKPDSGNSDITEVDFPAK
ncbi:MAG: hypothetical protein A2086_07190 [Spirochaetes bacterium GWD1_27_9]|nr:MAG: hypothetical protein A2Z98_11635 [Spirochaetes bacterium GWB1_27_13]OHD25694.1 MAG: hypothetical protein A2Y34_14345 [Spirochaetes bacterium GWC1_27_15]OHD32187.1 MAG: hypothetical protein A2086_07190 [Spirochaetes bacterium GWD1_27_9]